MKQQQQKSSKAQEDVPLDVALVCEICVDGVHGESVCEWKLLL
jgi:hypothetical protein